MKAGHGHGSVYQPKGRDGKRTQWYWLKYRFPGDANPRREPTNPRTDDPAEARRQLNARLGEVPVVRARRLRVEQLLVRDLLAFFVADCDDEAVAVPSGHVEAWMHVLGSERALDVETDHLDTIGRRWRKVGVTWGAGQLEREDGTTLTWRAREPARVRPLNDTTWNRYLATLRRAYRLGREKRGLLTPLTFRFLKETARGQYLTEDEFRAICTHWKARRGARVKADVFRLGYLLGIRKGQLRRTCKRHVLISGDTWKLKWPGEETKNGEVHEVVLVGEARDLVARAWAARLPDCDFLFHVDGQPLGPMRSEFRRTCQALGIPYGRGRGVVWHDSRHSAVTNLIGSGVPETIAMTITGHADRNVFSRYNVRRDDVQADALARQQAYLDGQRGTAPAPPTGHDIRARHKGQVR